MRKYYFLAIIFLTLITDSSMSQDVSVYKRLDFSVEPRYGFVAPHHDYMAYFLEKNITSIQVNLGLSTLGTKDWHICYNYPQIGIGYYYSGLGNDRIYGKMNALYLFVDRRFLPIQSRLNIGNRIAFGLSHISKQYDMFSNPYNMVISTPINVFIQYDLIAYYRISSTLNIRLNLGFTHTSNGSIKEPNKGFNIVTTGFGFQYSFNDERNLTNAHANVQTLHKHQINIGLISGFKSISRFDNKVYTVVGLSGEYLYKLTSTTLIGSEITGYWDTSIKDEYRLEGDGSYKKLDNLCVALNLNYALRMGTVLFTFQPGVYLKNNFNPYGMFTNKVGLRYRVTQNLYLSMAIKAHWLAKADFIEFGMRYNLMKSSI